MENIIRIALSTKFKEDQLDSIIAIANATANNLVAVEILLGTYKEPAIGQFAGDTDTKHNRTFESYDRFTDKVYYTYNAVSKKKAWFKKGTTEFTKENIASSSTWNDDAVKELNCSDVSELRDKYVYETYETVIRDVVSQEYMSRVDWEKDVEKFNETLVDL